MAVADVRNVQYIRGRLAKAPTDFTAAFPHGGTALGLFGKIELRIVPIRGEVTAEEYHGIPVEVIEGGERVVVGALLREYDADAISTLFPGTSTGTKTGKPVVARTFTTLRGGLGSARSVALVFSPEDTEARPALYLPRAVPLLAEQASLSYSISREWGVPVMFLALPDGSASGRIYQIGLLEDLTA